MACGWVPLAWMPISWLLLAQLPPAVPVSTVLADVMSDGAEKRPLNAAAVVTAQVGSTRLTFDNLYGTLTQTLTAMCSSEFVTLPSEGFWCDGVPRGEHHEFG